MWHTHIHEKQTSNQTEMDTFLFLIFLSPSFPDLLGSICSVVLHNNIFWNKKKNWTINWSVLGKKKEIVNLSTTTSKRRKINNNKKDVYSHKTFKSFIRILEHFRFFLLKLISFIFPIFIYFSLKKEEIIK